MLWLGIHSEGNAKSNQDLKIHWPKNRIGSPASWASLRARRFHNRPAHADQMHIDLWFKGNNVLLDAGTYLYNAPPPWRNALTSAINHNSVCVDGVDPMQKAGRFLWLDWAQAEILETTENMVQAAHFGYQKLGITHKRALSRLSESAWEVDDQLLSSDKQAKSQDFLTHWLLPDWPYQIHNQEIQFQAPFGQLTLETLSESGANSIQLNLIRSGETLVGEYLSPNLGWFSPTYNEKVPALSVLYQSQAFASFSLKTRITIMAK
jgi:hypothetical protein